MSDKVFNMKPLIRDVSPQRALPPITLALDGEPVRFFQATELLANAAGGDGGNFVLICIRLPGTSENGVYVALDPAQARAFADSLKLSAEMVERQLRPLQ